MTRLNKLQTRLTDLHAAIIVARTERRNSTMMAIRTEINYVEELIAEMS
jgi:hypothetical protein